MSKERFVSLEKMSKRKKKEYYAARRKDWGGINPVTRTTADLKVYNRKRLGKRFDDEPNSGPLRYVCDFVRYACICRFALLL